MDVSKMVAAAAKIETRAAAGGDSKSADTAAVIADHAQKVGAELKMQMATAGAGPRVSVGGGGGAGGYTIMRTDSKNTRKESLGKQTIEGVEAEGTRYTTTIAAGESLLVAGLTFASACKK